MKTNIIQIKQLHKITLLIWIKIIIKFKLNTIKKINLTILKK